MQQPWESPSKVLFGQARANAGNVCRAVQLCTILPILAMLAACATSQPSDSALADALENPLRACAGALAGDSMPTAREKCLPVVAVYQAATGR